MSIIGDVKSVLDILNSRLEQLYHKDWMDKALARKDALPLTYNHDVLTGAYVVEKLYELTQVDAIIAT